MTTAIDTLRIFERLRDAELPERAAKEIAEVLRGVKGEYRGISCDKN